MAKNSMYLYGKNSVLERLNANPKSIRQILLQENFNAPQITDIIKSKGLPVKYVTERELTRIKNADRLQGIVAEVEKFQYKPFYELLTPEVKSLSLIFLDNINDPHNLGSIIRITACFGDFAIVIPEHSACEINETVLHVASGGENYLPISKVTNLSTALREAKESGYWAVGAVVEGGGQGPRGQEHDGHDDLSVAAAFGCRGGRAGVVRRVCVETKIVGLRSPGSGPGLRLFTAAGPPVTQPAASKEPAGPELAENYRYKKPLFAGI